MIPITQINAAAGLITPEIILLATVCVMFLVGPFLVSETGAAAPGLRHRWGSLSLLALGAAWLTWFNADPSAATPVDYSGPFRVDAFVWFIRGVSLSIGFVLVLLAWNQISDNRAAEFHACLLCIVTGTNLVALANDMVGLFLALELVSIPTYVLLYLPRRDQNMQEATLKYFLLGVFSSGLMLYGMSWLFGATGTTNFAGIVAAAEQGRFKLDSGMTAVATALLIAGLGFRVTAVPFHFYAPDVFQGATSSAAALLSFLPKVVGFTALLRLIPLASGIIQLHDWIPPETTRNLLAALAVLTMFWGNLMALRQSNLHRLLAYSSVGHAGYMLIGLTVGDGAPAGVSGTAALLFYLVAYGVMTIGAFAVLAAAGSDERPVQSDRDLAGLSRSQPVLALLLAICLFSLTGLPPTAGFLGKLNLFLAAWSEGTDLGRGLAIALAINAVIAAWYYLRLIAVMYFEPAADVEHSAHALPSRLAAAICAVATVLLFLTPQWLWNAAAAVTQ